MPRIYEPHLKTVKKFDKKYFIYEITFTKESEAKKCSNKLKDMGFNTRIVKGIFNKHNKKIEVYRVYKSKT